MLGFGLSGKTNQSVPADEKYCIHCCCVNGSLLSNPISGTSMKVIDQTKERYFTDKSTANDIVRNIKGLGDVCFYCSLCAGGSTWQRFNLELAKRSGWEYMVVLFIDHWDLHWRLWANFEKVVKHCRTVGATVLREWPRFCDYWQEKRVAKFLETMNLKFTVFDGCMYGLFAKNKGKESLPIRKPWRIAYLNSSIASHLNRLCNGSNCMSFVMAAMRCMLRVTLPRFARP